MMSLIALKWSSCQLSGLSCCKKILLHYHAQLALGRLGFGTTYYKTTNKYCPFLSRMIVTYTLPVMHQ